METYMAQQFPTIPLEQITEVCKYCNYHFFTTQMILGTIATTAQAAQECGMERGQTLTGAGTPHTEQLAMVQQQHQEVASIQQQQQQTAVMQQQQTALVDRQQIAPMQLDHNCREVEPNSSAAHAGTAQGAT